MPTVRLTDIFRQAQRSLIVQNAHRIVEGQMPQKGGPKDDFFLIESNGLACQKLVCDLVSTRLPKAYGFDPVRDIQVLCPTKVGPTGSVELNRRLQDILNPPAKGKGQIGTAESAKILRLGDKVMQVKNDYDITFERAGAEAGVGAYNGDLGIITAVDVDARSVTVQMDDKKYTYTADQLKKGIWHVTIIAFVFCASVWSLSMTVPQVYARIFSASKSSWCTQAGQKSKAQLR